MRYLNPILIVLALFLSACGGGGTDGPKPLTIASASPPDGKTGAAYGGYTFSATGGTGPFSWSSDAAVPLGMYVDSTGQLAGTPVTAGNFTFTVTASDSSPTVQTAILTVSVKIADSPVVVDPSQAPPAAVHSVPYNGFAFGATGGSWPYSWTLSAGSLPPGMTLNADGSLTGTPTVARAAPYTFTATVTDSSTPTAETGSIDSSIVVGEPPPPSISTGQPPTAVVGTPYSFQFSAMDGLAPLVWSATSAPMGGLSLSSDGTLSGTAATAGVFPISLTVTDALGQTSTAQPFMVRIALPRPAAAFTPAGDMHAARNGHTATLLLDGRVLIAGGGPSKAEIYDPTGMSFTLVGDMLATQGPRSATLLANSALSNQGKVLIVGGDEVIAELFDPATGKFTATGSTLAPHLGQTATLLQNGKVLVAGGETAAAELFDPSTETFTATGSMTLSRAGHTATLLSDGRVLITGGSDVVAGTWPIPCCADASAEIYDPATGAFTPTGSMIEARSGHKATLLTDGTVLITGADVTADLFDPAAGTFSAVGQTANGFGSTATLRNDGTVLVAGGWIGRSTAAADLYAPESAGFVPTGPLVVSRDGHTATELSDGSVLVVGGTNHQHVCHPDYGGHHCSGVDTVLTSAEIYK